MRWLTVARLDVTEMMKLNQTLLCLLVMVSLVLEGCGIREAKDQANKIDMASLVSGQVNSAADTELPLYIQVYDTDEAIPALEAQVTTTSDGRYSIPLKPGKYFFISYVDANGNSKLDLGDSFSFLKNNFGEIATLAIDSKKTLSGQDFDFKIFGPVEELMQFGEGHESRFRSNLGRQVSIEDAMFSRENASTGLWRPLDFVALVGGGLMQLQAYDPQKIPILFIHGINGTPVDFARLIQSLDASRYQPWVFYYPSGFPLDFVSDYLLDATEQMHHRFNFDELIVFAHSMGGLMARSFLMKQHASEPSYRITKVFTVNSPMLGMHSAEAGVRMSPVLVPVWRDLVPNSEYIQRVGTWKKPLMLDHYLIFSYLEGRGDDGVVPLGSQLPRFFQQEATQIRGFQSEHTALLSDPRLIDMVVEILK